MRLTAEQRAAAAVVEGPLRVVAGPGTGKTAVIAERFRRLVARGVPAESILVLTFTERAAAEMRSRIAAAIGQEPPHVGTFHALAMRWLREDGRRAGVHPAFSILEGADRWIELRELMWELASPALVGEARPDDLVTPLLRVMERLKQELVPLSRLEAWCQTAEDRERAALLRAAIRLFRAFERQNRSRLRMDFDDVLVAAVRLLETQPDVLARYRDRFRHLMVDEYQDTNLAQERLVELLGAGGSVCVVGDDDQSIYRFRGASLASMERFLRVFPGAQTVTLGRNRRSSGAIVAGAAALIAANTDRIHKDLVAAGARGPLVEVLACADERGEAAAIADEVDCLRAQGTPLSGIAVLCRTNAVARPVVEALAARGLPARHWGAQGLYALPEVRDVLALLRVLVDPDDRVALARLLDRLGGGIEPGVRRLEGAETRVPALDVLAAWAPAAGWAAVLRDLRPLVTQLGAADLFFELMTHTEYLERPGLDAAGVASVTRLGEVIEDFCGWSSDQSLAALMHRLDLVQLSGHDEEVPVPEAGDEDAVQVMTIHQAKGLEFDAVFVPAMVEGRLPQPHRGEELEVPPAVLEPSIRGREDHVAEERRLAYVAMTRARRRLYLSWAERYEGTRAWRRSRFVGEVLASGRAVERRVGAAAPAPVPAAAAVDAGLGGDGGPTLSFSAIAAYRECPRQHWFRYRVHLPAPPSVEGEYGTVLHAVLMRAGAMRMRGEAVGLAELESMLDDEWARASFADPRRAPALRVLASRQLAAFHAAGGLAGRPAMVERSFTAGIDNWRLRGIIDRVDGAETPPPTLRKGGEAGLRGRKKNHVAAAAGARWRLVDYKTGSALPASRLRRDLQLALYALGAREGLGLEGDLELEIVYLKDGRHVVVPATAELLAEARRVGTEVAAAIAAERFEPRPERRRCSLCAYRLACAAAR